MSWILERKTITNVTKDTAVLRSYGAGNVSMLERKGQDDVNLLRNTISFLAKDESANVFDTRGRDNYRQCCGLLDRVSVCYVSHAHYML